MAVAREPTWALLDCGGEQTFAFAPAEVAIQWDPSAPTGKVQLIFTYWGTLVHDLPAALRPTGSDVTPWLTFDSAAAAAKALKELEAFVKQRFPNMKPKHKASLKSPVVATGALTRFLDGGDANFWITTHPETAADLALAAAADRGWTYKAGKDRVLLWATEHLGGLRVRAAADEIVFVDASHELADHALAKLVTGTATDHGVWKFASTLVARDAASPVTAIKGVTAKTVAALRAMTAKQSPRVIAPKGDAPAGALIAKLAGNFRGEIGGAPGEARWLRFVRV